MFPPGRAGSLTFEYIKAYTALTVSVPSRFLTVIWETDALGYKTRHK